MDDLSIKTENSIAEFESKGISVFIDIPETRTRAVDMTPGAAIYLNDIWVGVYRKSDGVRVGGAQLNLGNRLAASGTTIIDLVKLEFDGSIAYKYSDKYCVVGIANYDGIKITNNIDATPADGSDIEKDDLIFALQQADNWKDFIDIAIDTQKSLFPNQTPMLMGYLYLQDSNNAGSGYIYTKVNQFVDVNDNKVNLYPFGILSGYPDVDIFVDDKSNNGKIQSLDTDGYVMKLRRMRSKINVDIETRDDQMIITNLEYKVVNIPKSAYLAQRRTNIFDYTSRENNYQFEYTPGQNSTQTKYSPNSADVLNDGYLDLDWQKPSINNSFSFEHFENKHWAYYTEGLEDYHDRERTKEDGAFLNLVGVNENGPEWNNKASYFILKMNLRDEKEGRNAEVEYVIHEGFCNDKDGVTLVDDNGNTLSQTDFAKRLMDYSCIRNTDYYYKIKVLDVNKIKLQVTTSADHQYDQSGKIWQINYLAPTVETLIDKKEISAEVKLKPDNDPDFSNQDIAFRLLGTFYDEEIGQNFNVDLCYNFSHGDLDGFSGLWPVPTNESSDYIINTTDKNGDEVKAFDALTTYCEGTSPNAVYFNKLKDKILINHNGKYVNIVDYIKNIQDESVSPDIQGFQFDGLRLYVAKSSDSDKSNIRGLYIFDIQKAVNAGSRILTDEDQHSTQEGPCSYFYQINGIEQLPVYLAREDYEMIYVKNSGTPTVSSHLQPTVNNTNFTNFNNGQGGTGMLLSKYPDIAFRIVGFNQNDIEYINTTDYYDIWYNIKQDEYTDFTETGKWPERNLNGILSKEIAKGYLTSGDISTSFLDGIKIIKNSAEVSEVYDLYDFINKYETGQISLTNTDKLGFQVNQYDVTARVRDKNSLESKHKFMRALYLIDKKNPNVVPPLLNEDGVNSTATFQGYGVEQDPTLLDPITLTFGSVPSGSHTSKTYRNILDPYIDAVSIEPLKYEGNIIPVTDYKFRIYSGTGNALREAIITPVIGDNGYCTFNIPMIALSGTSGTLYLQAISQVGDEYFSEVFGNSDPADIGSYNNLQAPPTWNATILGNDFQKAYSYFNDQGSNYKNAYDESSHGPLEYLSFSGGNFGVGSNSTANSINLRSNSARISCKIYKPCKITVTTAGGGGGLDICLDSDIKYSSTNASVSYTVTKDDFGDKNELEMSLKRSTGSSTYVFSIVITES